MKLFDIIVAADLKNGIGKQGQLPWHLPADMAYFKKMTIATQEPGKRNALVMGRKTWESIPESFRPLPARLNMVLTRQEKLMLPDGVLQADSLSSAFEVLEKQGDIETIFIIGGASLFAQALETKKCRRLYLTRIFQDFQCDTFFPDCFGQFKQEHVSAPAQHDGVTYQFITLVAQ